MRERLPCCVPFCRRTAKADHFTEWICGKHWSLVSKRARRFKRLADSARARAIALCEAIEVEGYECAKVHGGVHVSILDRFGEAADRREKASKRCARAWERCKAQAIERAAGL